ncbi:hypothetical protein FGB62_139g218 [Gracilaria domingensis]|nr:hypothetical protein FGB62_139g218 [Gracilaria domingensis]
MTVGGGGGGGREGGYETQGTAGAWRRRGVAQTSREGAKKAWRVAFIGRGEAMSYTGRSGQIRTYVVARTAGVGWGDGGTGAAQIVSQARASGSGRGRDGRAARGAEPGALRQRRRAGRAVAGAPRRVAAAARRGGARRGARSRARELRSPAARGGLASNYSGAARARADWRRAMAQRAPRAAPARRRRLLRARAALFIAGRCTRGA